MENHIKLKMIYLLFFSTKFSKNRLTATIHTQNESWNSHDRYFCYTIKFSLYCIKVLLPRKKFKKSVFQIKLLLIYNQLLFWELLRRFILTFRGNRRYFSNSKKKSSKLSFRLILVFASQIYMCVATQMRWLYLYFKFKWRGIMSILAMVS